MPNKTVRKVIRVAKTVGIYLAFLLLLVVLGAPFYNTINLVFQPGIFIGLGTAVEFVLPTFWLNILNSVVVAGLRAAGAVLFCTMGGYAFAKFDFKAKPILFGAVLVTMVIPDFLVIIPFFKMMVAFHWTNNYFGLVIPGMVSGLGIFLIRQYIVKAIHNDLLDAARIDGLNEYQIFFKIVFPLVTPGIGLLALKSFIDSWNEVLRPLVLLSNQLVMTISVAILRVVALAGFASIMAAAVSMLPLILLFVLFSKTIISGLTAGSLKY